MEIPNDCFVPGKAEHTTAILKRYVKVLKAFASSSLAPSTTYRVGSQEAVSDQSATIGKTCTVPRGWLPCAGKVPEWERRIDTNLLDIFEA